MARYGRVVLAMVKGVAGAALRRCRRSVGLVGRSAAWSLALFCGASLGDDVLEVPAKVVDVVAHLLSSALPSALCLALCPALLLAQPMWGDWETESGEARDESMHVRIDIDAYTDYCID